MDNDILLEELARSRGLFGNTPDSRPQLDFNPGGMLGPLGSNPLAVMLGQSLLNKSFAGAGYMPAQFSPGTNLFRQMEAKAYAQARQTALAQAASADRMTHMEILQGLAKATGTPFGLQQRRAAGVIASDLSLIAPTLAQAMPEMYDALHGARGSAVVMAEGIHRGGRFQRDPATGRMKLSGESAAAISRTISEQFFGPGADLASFRGLSMGQVGLMYDELANRGMLGRGLGTLSRDDRISLLAADPEGRREAIDKLAREDATSFERLRSRVGAARPDLGLAGKTADEARQAMAGLDKDVAPHLEEILKSSSPTHADDLARRFDAKTVGGRLKNLAGAVSAMREIFGDMGRPNAPMGELLSGLEALTQGGMATMTPAELERMARTTGVLARTTGMGLQAMVGLTAQGGAAADQLGIGRGWAVQAAQGSAAFGAALGQSGRLANPAPGLGSRDELTLIDNQLRIRAGNSDLMNRMGAAARYVELERAAGRGAAVDQTALGRYVSAAIAGQNEFVMDPSKPGDKTKLLDIERDQLLQMFQQAGASSPSAQNFLLGKASNLNVAQRLNFQRLGRAEQGAEMARFLASPLTAAMTAELTPTLGADKARQVARAIGERQGFAMLGRLEGADAKFNISDADLKDAGRRSAAMSDLAADTIARMAPGAKVDRGALERASEAAWGQLDQSVKTNRLYSGYKSAINLITLHSKDTIRLAESVEDDARVKAEMETAVAPLAKVGPLARVMDLFRRGDVTDPSSFLAQALGGVDPAQAQAAVAAIPVDQLAKSGAIRDQDRLTLAMGQFVELAGQFETVQRRPAKTDQELRARVADGQSIVRTMEALRRGGDHARGELARLQAKPNRTAQEDRLVQALRASVGGGIDDASARLGMRTDAAVGQAQTGDWLEQLRMLDASPAGGAEARRYAAGVDDRGGRLLDALLGDEASISNLGAGGFDLAKGARSAYLDLQFEAGELGVPLADLLSGKVEAPDEAKKRIGDLRARLGASMRDIDARLRADPAARARMGDDELKRAREFIGRESRDDASRSRDLLDRVLGGAAVDGRDELARQFGEGPEAERRRQRFARLMGERTQLEGQASIYGGLEAMHRMVLDDSDGRMDPVTKASLRGKFERLGAFGDSLTRENIAKMVDRTKDPVDDKPVAVELNGVLQITPDGRTAKISGRGQAQGRLGTVPTAAPAAGRP